MPKGKPINLKVFKHLDLNKWFRKLSIKEKLKIRGLYKK